MKYLIITICLFISYTSIAKESTTKVLQSQLDKKILKSRLNKKTLGIEIHEFKSGISTSIFSLNSDKKFVPASLSKIPTALAAYEYLGPNYKFETSLATDGSVSKGVLKGNLYFIGGGDPTFTSESLWSLVNRFKRENIHTIEKNIIVDDTYFDSIRYDKRRDPVRKDRAYDAPVGALSFNWNSVNIFIRPTTVGSQVQVNIDPTDKYFKLVNKARTVSGRRHRLKVSRIASKDGDQFPYETIVVSGSIGVNAREYVSYKSITRPDIWAGYSLKKFLEERGIQVKGKVTVGKKPQKAKVRSVHSSEPLFESIKSMNKYSNNFVAEMLIKNIAANFKTPATMDHGLEKANKFLVKSGFTDGNYKFINASGLTRGNLFRPLDFTNFLVKAKKNTFSYPEFLVSLPISAIDGTLKSRMTKLASAKKVRAKTGMLNEVIGLAGFIEKEDTTYVFTFIYNGSPKKLKNARDLFDYLTEVLSK